MPAETIWSNNSSQENSSTPQYRTVLEQVDPEIANMFDSSRAEVPVERRRLSFNNDTDGENGLFGLKRGSLSAITAPVYPGTGQGSSQGGPQRMNFGTASISGGIASRHPPQDSFFQKFSSVADATRDIELSNGLSTLSFEGPSSRRPSFNNESGIKSLTDVAILTSPQSSLNENLNMPPPRTSRHQSISEKIDHYNNNSPIQSTASLSISTDPNPKALSSDQSIKNAQVPSHNFWNPAAAPSFTPANSYHYFMDGGVFQGGPAPPPPPPNAFASYGPRKGQSPFNGSGFIVPPQSPMDPNIYNMSYEGDIEFREDSKDELGKSNVAAHPKSKKINPNNPGIGLINRQISPPANFMLPAFNPYSVYQNSSSPVGDVLPTAGQPISSEQASSNAGSFDKQLISQQSISSSTKRKNTRNSNGHGKNGNHIYRSPLLEEVRSNSKGKDYYLKDIYGHAVEFTKDQHGSRFIQQKLPNASEEEKEVIFNEIRDISYDLMTDVFGNYVIQKFFEHGSTTQKQILLDHMIGHIYELSLQMYGCRVVQRALEAVNLENQIRVIEELRDYVLICAKDQNGNHVIQKSIERIPFERIKFILESLDNHIYHLSTHPYGCRVIQRLLEYSAIEDQERILNELNRFIFYLIQDQYGNYVMQHILERGELKDREEILKVVLGSVVNFSKHKFASNVIEKCIKFGTLDQRKRILYEVMLGNEDFEVDVVSDDSPLALMMKDQYANYVIQKLVEGFDAKSEEKKILVVKLRQYLKQISSKNTYGKHLASVEKMIIVAENALIEAEKS
ncbi:uncharacterized protein PRCAT00000270001 [Priceomyces carsonii]|uniref:uncharacterized protein n=1 Tax=Priceomyces carsonii TaxID=28549 RepID=UPI002ED7B46E|nr:unnamed protein product [Priceomyces carsonii]